MQHEQMPVYLLALEFFEGVHTLTATMPRRWRYLIDQLQRASLSILLNIAEGAGEFSPAEKARFYRIAQRSAIECRTALDAANRLHLLQPQHAHLHEMAGKIYAQLVGLARSLDARAAQERYR
jgi:four helix bundle protein